MLERRSLRLPITLGVLMITVIVALIVGWVILTSFSALRENDYAPMYWTLLSVGTLFLAFVLVGVVLYLTLSVKAINLNRRQSNFIDSVTHELKSPIASLKLYLQTFNRRSVSIDERKKFYKFMLDDVERLDHLINHLLSAGHIDKSLPSDSVESIHVDKLVRDIAASVSLRYSIEPDSFQFDIEPCSIEARKTDIDLILRNIIDNAAKYSGSPPEIQIHLRKVDEGNILVRVIDNGRGIPSQMRRKVFGRFVRLGSELTREKPGTGLGLYIVRTLVKRCGGTVTLGDTESGSGTVFDVRLPGKTREAKNEIQKAGK